MIHKPELELSLCWTTYTFRVRLRLTDVGPRGVIPKVVAMVVVVSFVSHQDAGAPRRITFLKERLRAIGSLMSKPTISNSPSILGAPTKVI
jgi:hypothetical protein